MDSNGFERDAYFARIGYDGVVEPTEDCLDALHRSQLYTIPFENFDILLGRGISLEIEALFDNHSRIEPQGFPVRKLSETNPNFCQNSVRMSCAGSFSFPMRSQ